MNSKERVLRACEFFQPDRIPRVEFFWEYPYSWQAELGSIEKVNDVTILVPNEGAFPSRAKIIQEEHGVITEIDRWGRTIRRRPGAYFAETLEAPLSDQHSIDTILFDPVDLEQRYLQIEVETILDQPLLPGILTPNQIQNEIERIRQQSCVFGKTGGPYLRSTYLRGEAQFLLDIASDPSLAKAIADKVADHLIGIGLQEIQRWELYETGIWIFDDLAYNAGPMFSPKTLEKVFLPSYRRMVTAFKKAGARYVFFHSDGDIRLFLDMLIDAGIDGINPVEPRANMKIPELRQHYPRLILTGGMDNTRTLVHGPVEKIQAEASEIIDVGRHGGVIIGSGSIGPEISLNNFLAYHNICRSYGDFAQSKGINKFLQVT